MRKIISLILSVFFLFIGSLAYAATVYYYVDPLGTDDGGHGTAAGASAWATIQYAVSNVSNPTSDTIIIYIAAGTYTTNNDDISIDRNFTNLTLQGDSAPTTIIQSHADPASATARLFTVGWGENVTFQDLTIKNGKNTTGWEAAGISANSDANITVLNCTFDNCDNSGSVTAGALYVSRSSCIVRNSTFTNCNGSYCGAAFLDGSYTELTNCTFSNNSGTYMNIYSRSDTFIMTNCTVANNIGVGFEPQSGTFYLKNNIFANNTSNDVYSYRSPTVISNGYNIVESWSYGEASSTNPFQATGDLYGEQASLNLSDTLADNDTLVGTQTLALSAGSVAIDAGDAAANNGISVPGRDQRGYFYSGAPDIGAYEYNGTTEAEPSASTPTSIAQTTDGTGYISFQTTVTELTNAVCSLKVEYSDDGGSSWYDPDLVSVSGDESPTLDDAQPYQIAAISSTEDGNTLTIVWDTLSASNGNGTLDSADQSDIQVRVTANDTITDSAVATSASFDVDNLDPTLDSISWSDVDSSGTISATDTLTFTFSEAMKTTTVDNAGGAADVDTVLAPSAGNFGDAGASGISWSDSSTLVVTLGSGSTVVSGATVNPTAAVTDAYGNADATGGGVAIVDNVAPTPTFNPLDAATGVAVASNITLTFNEAVRNTDDSALSDANVDALITLKETDADGDNIAFDATIDGDKKVITINPDSNFSSEQVVYVAIGATVEDAFDNAITTANATFTTADTINPTLDSIAWSDVDGSTDISATDTLTFNFSEVMDMTTVDNAGGATDVDTVLAPSAGIYGTAGVAGISWSNSSTLVVTLGAGATVASGATVNPTAAVEDEASNADNTTVPPAIADNVGPTLNSITWTDVDGSTDISVADTLAFTFSEAMDTSTITTANINTVLDSSATGAADYGDVIASVVWSGGDKVCTVTLTAGFDVADGSTVNPTAAVTDVAGNADATSVAVEVSDNVGPTLSSISWTDVDSSTDISATDTLTFTFSEAMDTATVDNAGGAADVDTVLAPSAGNYGTTGASGISWSDSSTLVVTLGTAPTVASGATVNPTAAVTDAAGNADATSSPPSITDNVSPTLNSIAWTDVDSSTDISAGDTLAFTFSEAMDTSTITTANINTVLDSSATGSADYGDTISSVAWSGGNKVCTVTLTAGFDIASGDTVNPTDAVTDAAGNADLTAPPGPGSSLPPGVADNVGPELLTVVWADVDSSKSINATDTLTFTFSEAMNTATVDNGGGAADVDTVLAPSAGNYGAAGASGISWTDSKTLVVTLGSSPTVAGGATVNPTDAVADAYANADNTTAPGPEITTYVITAAAGDNGSVSPSGSVVKNPGTSQTFTITPDTGYHIDDVLADSVSVGAIGAYTFEAIAANHTLVASFEIDTFLITSEAGSGGSISPLGATTKNYGSSQTYTITPDAGYEIESLSVDSVTVTSTAEYTFTNITSGHLIEAAFVTTTTTTTTTTGGTTTTTTPPVQITKPGGVKMISGDIISSTEKITIVATSSPEAGGASASAVQAQSVDPTTFRLYIDDGLITDGTHVYYDSCVELGNVATFEYTPRTPLSIGTHSIRISFVGGGVDATTYEATFSGLKVMATVAVVGDPLCYPNPYNPSAGNLRISYTLATDTNITVYVFNSNGGLEWKDTYDRGGLGASAGYNEITWNGNSLANIALPNNVYFIRIVDSSNGTMLGKTKLMVLK